MPLVDVNDILLDPDVAGQRFTVIRRQDIVNSFGESTVAANTIPNVIGSVQPDGDNKVIRDGAFDAQANGIIVATPFRLRGVSRGPSKIRYKPDIIISGILGEPTMYEVTDVIEWNDFGRGFIEVKATSITWVDFPPAPLVPLVGRLDFSNPSMSALAYGAAGGGSGFRKR